MRSPQEEFLAGYKIRALFYMGQDGADRGGGGGGGGGGGSTSFYLIPILPFLAARMS